MLSHESITIKVYMSQEKCHPSPEPITLPKLDRRCPSSKLPHMHATSADQIAHCHSLSTTYLDQLCCLSGLPLIKSNLLKQSPEPRKPPEPNTSRPLDHPPPHPGLPFDALAVARYKKTANHVHPEWTTPPE